MSKKVKEYAAISAEPVKSFFVSMLTRDIHLEDAILDLLDNCVDGILRSASNESLNGSEPYKGYWAEIDFSKDSFSIRDNCGGIPCKLHDYAFRMGRPHNRPLDTSGTVGVYGIGMKRAIFKIGEHCWIESKNEKDEYCIEITPDWIASEEDWSIPVKSATVKEEGTTIFVKKLHKGTMALFGNDKKAFSKILHDKIAEQYAIIIDKGFSIKVNGKTIEPLPTELVFAKDDSPQAIRPYIFKAKIEEVDVFLTVGFTSPIPSNNDALDEQESPKYSSQNAGWTIVCNDRVVLYCDRSELTGWGVAGIPRYHTQFIAIAGIVEFRSNDASRLPMTTTKRGVDASSTLYLRVKDKMREGMKCFTDYTNKWKGQTDESKKHFDKTKTEQLSLARVKEKVKELTLNKTQNVEGEQYIPKLPKPQKETSDSIRRIMFTVEKEKIKPVIDYLQMDQGSDPSDVGKQCFTLVYEEAIS